MGFTLAMICPGFVQTERRAKCPDRGWFSLRKQQDRATAGGMASGAVCTGKWHKAIETQEMGNMHWRPKEVAGIYLKRFFPKVAAPGGASQSRSFDQTSTRLPYLRQQ